MYFVDIFPFFHPLENHGTEEITLVCPEQHLYACFLHLLLVADSSKVKQALLAWQNCPLRAVLLGSISRKGN